jgi:sirohydrochlorin ferrochelatase
MKGILIVAHGSREKETEETFKKIVVMLRKKLENENIEYAFMQFCEKTIEKAIAQLVNNGVNDIKVIPYFLFDGVHIKEDIPAKINELCSIYPDIKISFGNTLGADYRLADILADRVSEIL